MSQIPSSASIRARRAESRYPKCPVCANADVDGLHVDRCRERETYRQHALAAGRTAGIPDVTTTDLWAHADSRTHSPLYATAVVQLVIDLGWRPVVGSEPKRLWAQQRDRATRNSVRDAPPSGANVVCTEVEWAVVDDGQLIHIAGANSPADALAGAHGHGTHGPIGVAHRTVTRTPWQHLTDQPTTAEEPTDG